jgi:phosphoglucomutase
MDKACAAAQTSHRMSDLRQLITAAAAEGHLLQSSSKNLLEFLDRTNDPLYRDSIGELAEKGQWDELNDRFFKTLAFGTGGLRGRTIGKVVTEAERGEPQLLERPQHSCVGTNAMNAYNVSRATQGLVAYLKKYLAETGSSERPKIAVAYDTRHFSPDFAALTARVATEIGADVALFEAPRSTPELSFAVRHQNAHAGIVITASHNPPHDNGYKVYFLDGAQVVKQHADGIIREVNAVESEVYEPVADEQRGQVIPLGNELDGAYMDRLETLVLDPALVRSANDLHIVFTSIHGTGGIIVKPMLERLGFTYSIVPEQEIPDSRFPTVKSPNPEEAAALAKAIDLAREKNADLVIATDPDCDRMGVAARNREGEMILLSGNQIGSLMAYYRVRKLVEQGVITPATASRCVIVKTFVTTPLQNAIADAYGLRCVDTLTGFKYIGEKLGKYEAALPAEARAKYRSLSEAETRRLRLEHSSFYVCGGEESYGYSAADFIRDKDGNGAAVVFAEVAAYAKSRGLTLPELLDEVYVQHGYFLEKNHSLTFEGAEGALKIAKLAASYAQHPPTEVDGSAVVLQRDFASETFTDVEGDTIPKENMLIVDLADGRRFAVRPSGTEPKIKFYLYGRQLPPFEAADLPGIKARVTATLDSLWAWIRGDVDQRLT